MTESTHTPGTWEYSNGKVYGEIIEIASLCQPVVQEEEAMVEANGRLIAAAPELLQVARDYVLLCDLYDWEGHVLDTAHAAIAKAEGGAA